MARLRQNGPELVILFVEGDTDEIFFNSLIEFYRNSSVSAIRPCRVCNLHGVTRYISKVKAKLLNELVPAARKKNMKVHTVCCSYDTDVFHTEHPLVVNWNSLRKDVKRMGIDNFIRLNVSASIEDWILDDLDSICNYLNIAKGNTCQKGTDGNAKLINLFKRAGRVYQKGAAAKDLIAHLDFYIIRNRRLSVLSELEELLGVTFP